MANAMKNWEAQARTNSILAGSLKALEERVDDIAELLSWRNDLDVRFEQMLNSVSALESRVDSNDIFRFQENQTAFMESKHREAQAPTIANAVQLGGQVDASGNVPFKDKNMLRRMSGGVPPGAKVVHPSKYLGIGFLIHHGFMLLVGICLFVAVAEVRDIASQVLVILLAFFCLGSAGVGIAAAVLRTSTSFTWYLCWQQLVLAVAAVYFQRGLDEAVKSTQFCDLKGVVGIPDSDCEFREFTSSMRVFLCGLVIVSTVASTITAVILKDEVVRAEIHNGVEIDLPSLLIHPLSQAVEVTKSLALIGTNKSSQSSHIPALPLAAVSHNNASV